MATVIVYCNMSNPRAKFVCDSVFKGIKKIGMDNVKFKSSKEYGGVEADIAVMYGWANGLRNIYEDYRINNKAIYIDLGYWRKSSTFRYENYYKFTINTRHPISYFQNEMHKSDRFNQLNIPIKPWKTKRKGKIMVAGMSAKAARAEGFSNSGWEKSAISTLLQCTDRELVYRPKPNCRYSRRIDGASYETTKELNFKGYSRVVTHHSNVAIHALLEGIPIYCEDGITRPMSCDKLEDIETPYYSDNRHQWCYDAAYLQWTMSEAEQGLPWKHLKDEALI